MAAPLIVAGAKVAAKVAAKKIAAKQAAKIAAKQAGKKIASEGAKKVAAQSAKKVASKQATGSSWQKAKKIMDKMDRAQEVKDSLTPEKKEEEKKKPSVYKKNLLNRFLGDKPDKEGSQEVAKEKKPEKFDWKKIFDSSAKTEESSEKQSTGDKMTFYSAMFFAIIKDGIEILLTIYLLGWLIPILSFLPTVILTAILFLSKKKGTMKIVFYLVCLFVDYLIPGVNAVPITTIAVFITFKVGAVDLKNVQSKDVKKGLEVVKKFIK